MTPAQMVKAARVARLLRSGWMLERINESHDAAESHNDRRPQVMKELADLIETAELLRDAVWAKDNERSIGAIASLLLGFMTAFGHDDDFIGKALPSLKRLKELVLMEEFEEAETEVLAWLFRLRETDASLANALWKC